MPRTLNADEVRAAVPMRDAVKAVRDAFAELDAGHFTQPERLVFGDGRVLVMTAYHEPSATGVVKTLGIRLDRDPAILGTVVWAGAGEPLVADATAVTALRTGAVTGVATDLLAPPDAGRLALLGSGAQAGDQVRAIAAVRELREVAIHSRTAGNARSLADRLGAEFPAVAFRVAESVEDALADAEIVNCATSSEKPLFALSALPENVHVNAIGSFRPSMRELPGELLATASLVVVDQIGAALEEAGEVIEAVEDGLLDRASIVELGAVLREPPAVSGRTVFKSVGVAAQDWAIARSLAGYEE
ncbi:ornithine cyclodeaminase family protein [Amycolatopsis sp. BJA-103]|uniref:ornithine cyclodeaminase family protein n=1 Tax=Amycolatopsis sp. BJA-103 TaxID=1911175 RepID=UPI000C790785|nr:ornithine cyclodeaminase family protein [Amycolatopsis sp. BJA-103]AUI64078.1 ornithine cyclodeaminase [Amycolatopsis sp. BJA-103]PNE16110.1 ornithine cyclodeaminase [Amycolatopsis sp. BJA-103]